MVALCGQEEGRMLLLRTGRRSGARSPEIVLFFFVGGGESKFCRSTVRPVSLLL